MSNFERLNGRWIAYDADGYAFELFRRDMYREWIATPVHLQAPNDTRRFYARTMRQAAELVAQSRKRNDCPDVMAHQKDICIF